jgi:hypothetical protein
MGMVNRAAVAPRVGPIVIEPAYDDPAQVRALLEVSGPYPCLAGSAGYTAYDMPASPWFRSMWATDGRCLVPGAEVVFENPHFVAAAQRAFGAEIVRPFAVVVNLMGPMPAGVPHLDIPTFRGLPRATTTPWLLSMMGSSGLFDRWAVRVAGAISWFYDGAGGAYEWWPSGPGGGPLHLDPPFGNTALVGDNDYMFHRVTAIGDPARFDAACAFPRTSELVHDGDAWTVCDGDGVHLRFADDEVRASLLWRGLAFTDADDAARFDDHTDDLDLDGAVDVFLADLRRHGVDCARPADPLGDPEWVATLHRVYGHSQLDT